MPVLLLTYNKFAFLSLIELIGKELIFTIRYFCIFFFQFKVDYSMISKHTGKALESKRV